MAQTTFSTLNLERAGELIQIEQAKQERIQLLTEQLSLRHSELVASLTRPEGLLATVPPFVSELPAADLLIHTAAVRTITPHEDYEEPADAQKLESTRVVIVSETAAFLEVTLQELNPAYAEQYAGAKSASEGTRSDWRAQWGSSMRRLLKGVLHTVAHDDLVLLGQAEQQAAGSARASDSRDEDRVAVSAHP
ncbi:MAG: hypothetical protein M3541_09005 [Acidobacteriota bacterium]|nr:hypothetical protein [Acidobacteriota bacterium]